MLRALVKQADGSCCTCAKQIDACNCNNNTCSIECRSKSGTASLCGYLEYISPSDPPKVYRRQQPGGTTTFQFGTAFAGCSPVTETQVYTRSGAYQFDAHTCAETNTQIEHESSSTGFTADNVIPKEPVSLFAGFFFTETKAPTTRTFSPTPGCHGAGTGSPNSCSGDSMLTLSDEDTEDDAIARAAAPLSYTGCTCGTDSCSAFITDRTGSGSIVIGWRTVETRVLFTGLTTGQSYLATLGLSRRVLGTGGPFIDFGTMEISFTVDDPTHASAWQPVPNEAGWETIVSGCVVTLE
jgi:hypothetical protein